MTRSRKQKLEEGVLLVEHVEVGLGSELTKPQSCEERKTIERRCSLPRKHPHGTELKSSQRVKALEQENAKLRRLVAELSLQKLALKDILVSKGL
jgi:putative transposase